MRPGAHGDGAPGRIAAPSLDPDPAALVDCPTMPTLKELKVPAYWAEGTPSIDLDAYRLVIGGMAARPVVLSLEEVRRLATDVVDCRLTSVTRWSVRVSWRGILAARIAEMVGADEGARYVRLTSAGGGYFTVVERRDLEHPRALLAVEGNGEALSVDYGGPVRAVFPQLWGYKSAKGLVRVEFVDRSESGYWERRGYEGDAAITETKLFDLNLRQTRHHGGGEVTW